MANLDIYRFHTKKTSPLTNIVLSNLDLRPNAQIKQTIDAYVQGADIFTMQHTAATKTVLIK